VFVDPDTTVRGTDAIREAHREFKDSGLTFALNDSVVFEADDLALVHWSWTVTADDGSTVDGSSAEVLRRQPNGEWKFIIDNSDGSAVLGLKSP
jgi:ketosteroid isomerase-like protein